MPGPGAELWASGIVTHFTAGGGVNLRYGRLQERTGYNAVVLGMDL